MSALLCGWALVKLIDLIMLINLVKYSCPWRGVPDHYLGHSGRPLVPAPYWEERLCPLAGRSVMGVVIVWRVKSLSERNA